MTLTFSLRDWSKIRAVFDNDKDTNLLIDTTVQAVAADENGAEQAAKVFQAQAIIARAVARQARRQQREEKEIDYVLSD